jgi:hypothetical protein
MPQISLYIDKDTLQKIERIAKKRRTSISKWVGNNLKKLIKDDYPDDFFSLFGAIRDDSFNKHPVDDFSHDSKRENL